MQSIIQQCFLSSSSHQAKVSSDCLSSVCSLILEATLLMYNLFTDSLHYLLSDALILTILSLFHIFSLIKRIFSSFFIFFLCINNLEKKRMLNIKISNVLMLHCQSQLLGFNSSLKSQVSLLKFHVYHLLFKH